MQVLGPHKMAVKKAQKKGRMVQKTHRQVVRRGKREGDGQEWESGYQIGECLPHQAPPAPETHR